MINLNSPIVACAIAFPTFFVSASYAGSQAHFQALSDAALAELAPTAGAGVQDCETIQTRIGQLPSEGGEVTVADGIYECAQPLVLNRSHITLRGTGHVTLRLADNANSPLVILGDTATPPLQFVDVHLKDMQLDGNRKHQQIECWGGVCDGAGTAKIRNNGVTVRGIHGGSVENVQVTSPRSGGLVTEQGCADLLIDRLTVTDSEFDGLAVYETTASVFSHMTLSENAAAGISIDLNFNSNIVRDSLLSHNRDVGIFMRQSNDNLFSNIVIESSGNHGVFLADSELPQSCPSNNEFTNLTVSNSHGNGFWLNSSCLGNRITGIIKLNHNLGCYHEPTSGLIGIHGQVICEQ